MAIGSVSYTAAYSRGYKVADQEHERYYANADARDKAYRECLETSATIPEAAYCVEHTGQATREAERAEQDLSAQREMAQWAEGMLWATLIVGVAATGVSLLGVHYIKKTLIQADDTNAAAEAANEANRIARAEQRPWLVIEREVNCEFFDHGHGGSFVWNYKFVNKGKMPAYDCRLSVRLIRRNGLMGMAEQLNGYAAERIEAHTIRGTSAVVFAGESSCHRKFFGTNFTRYGHNGEFEVGRHIMLMACLVYRLTRNGNEFGFDARMFEIQESGQYLGPFGHTILEFGSARVLG